MRRRFRCCSSCCALAFARVPCPTIAMPSHLVVSLELPLPIRRGKNGIPALSDAARQQLRALLRLRLDRDPALAARVLRGRKVNDMTKEALWDACLSAGLRLSVTPGPEAP